MNTLVEHLNRWGAQALQFAWPMLWQSSLLIASLFVLDFALGRKMRAAVRYALWLVVGVKLLLPPTFALPSGLGWWVRHAAPVQAELLTDGFVVTYQPAMAPTLPAQVVLPASRRPWRPALSIAGYALLGSLAISLALLLWMIIRWRQVSRDVRGALNPTERLSDLLVAAQRQARLRRPVLLRLTTRAMSPAVCGLFRPRILLPQSLAERLPDTQIRAVLLHELFHLKRGDVWVNCVQALIQVCYWWHPLVWIANARIRQLREEAVDDAVMAALGEEAETYAPTLVEVAKLALTRPLTSLGLVGILESKGLLRQRIERLLNFRAPRRAGLTMLSTIGILSFAAVAVPMGEAPGKLEAPPVLGQNEFIPWRDPDPRFPGYQKVELDAQFLIVDQSSLTAILPSLTHTRTALFVASNDVANLENQLKQAGARSLTVDPGLSFPKFSGGQFHWHVGGVQTNMVGWQTGKTGFPGSSLVIGANYDCVAIYADWMPLAFSLVPWDENDGIRCQMELVLGGNTQPLPPTEVTIPPGGGVLWGSAIEANPGKYQFVFLRRVPQVFPESKQNQATQPFSNAIPEVRINLGPIKNNNAQPTPLSLHDLLARTNLVHASKGREAIYKKLESIRLDEVRFDNLPLSEVILKLSDEVKKHDPTGRGINFIINPGSIDPGTGLPLPAKPPVFDVAAVPINISPQLLNVRLVDALDAVIKAATKPLEYSIEDYAVVFAAKGSSAMRLYVRIINVGTNALSQALESVNDSQLTNTQARVRANITKLGVDLTPPKSVYFNEKEGTLVVRAALQDLEIIENSLLQQRIWLRTGSTGLGSTNANGGLLAHPQEGAQSLGPPYKSEAASDRLFTRIIQLDSKTIFAILRKQTGLAQNATSEQQQEAFRKWLSDKGIDLQSPKHLFYNDREGRLLIRATLSELDKVETFVQLLNLPDAQINLKVKFIELNEQEANAFWEKFTPANTASTAAWAVEISASQARTELQQWSAKNAKLVNEASVTTLSGRKTVISTTHSLSGPNPLKIFQPTRPQGVVEPVVEYLELGPAIEIFAELSEDGYTVTLGVTASTTNFLGYGDTFPMPRRMDTRLINGDAVLVPAQDALPVPRFRVDKMVAQAQVRDGHVLVLGHPIDSTGAPAEKPGDGEKRLLVFVTPTGIDPAGNRLHSDDEVPRRSPR